MGAKAKHDLAPIIRAAFANAIDLIKRDTGKTFSQMMQEAINEHGILPVLDRLSKFTVREAVVNATVDHTHKIEIVQEETRRIIAELTPEPVTAGTAVIVQDGPVLPDPVRIQ